MISNSRICLNRTLSSSPTLSSNNSARQTLRFLYPRWCSCASQVAVPQPQGSLGPTREYELSRWPGRDTSSVNHARNSNARRLGQSVAVQEQCLKTGSGTIESYWPEGTRYRPRSGLPGLRQGQRPRVSPACHQQRRYGSTYRAIQTASLSKGERHHGGQEFLPFNSSPNVLRVRHPSSRETTDTPQFSAELYLRLVQLSRRRSNIRQKHDETVLELGKNVVAEITGHNGPTNMWMHTAGSGCEIHVQPSMKDPLKNCRITLRGQSRARELGQDFLLQTRLQRECSTPTTDPRIDSDHSRVTSTATVSMVMPHTNVAGFYAKVRSVVTPSVSRAVRRERYAASNTTHNQIIAETLIALFAKSRSSRHASTAALNVALTFLNRHTELGSHFERLVSLAQGLGLASDVRTCNIMLNHYLKIDRPSKLDWVTAHMGERDIRPNAATWAILYRYLSNAEIRASTLRHAKSLGHLSNASAQRTFGKSLVESNFQEAIANANGIYLFAASMDDKIGSEWLSAHSVGRMIFFCARSEAWSTVADVLHLADEREVQLTEEAITYLAYAYRRRGDVHSVVKLLTSRLAQSRGVNDHLVIPFAFMTAWDKRYYDVCKVLWRYAVTQGVVSHTMESVGRRRRGRRRGQALQSRWSHFAAKAMHNYDTTSSSQEDKLTQRDEFLQLLTEAYEVDLKQRRSTAPDTSVAVDAAAQACDESIQEASVELQHKARRTLDRVLQTAEAISKVPSSSSSSEEVAQWMEPPPPEKTTQLSRSTTTSPRLLRTLEHDIQHRRKAALIHTLAAARQAPDAWYFQLVSTSFLRQLLDISLLALSRLYGKCFAVLSPAYQTLRVAAHQFLSVGRSTVSFLLAVPSLHVDSQIALGLGSQSLSMALLLTHGSAVWYIGMA